jgi:hypothetical protein
MQNNNILLLDETGFIPSFAIPAKELQLANAATSAWIQVQKAQAYAKEAVNAYETVYNLRTQTAEK